MSDLALIAKLPDVKSAVLGDLGGAFLDAIQEPDGETVAAVMGFVATHLVEAGAQLGLGGLRTVSVAGPVRGCLVAVRDRSVLTATVEPSRSLGAVEKAVETSLKGWD